MISDVKNEMKTGREEYKCLVLKMSILKTLRSTKVVKDGDHEKGKFRVFVLIKCSLLYF
jgi:hypothetical protein